MPEDVPSIIDRLVARSLLFASLEGKKTLYQFPIGMRSYVSSFKVNEVA